MRSKACAVVGGMQQAATDDTIAWPPGVTGYAQWLKYKFGAQEL